MVGVWTGFLAGVLFGMLAAVYSVARMDADTLGIFGIIAFISWSVAFFVSIPYGLAAAAVVGWVERSGRRKSQARNAVWLLQTVLFGVLMGIGLLDPVNYLFLMPISVNFFVGLWVTHRRMAKHEAYWAWGLPQETRP
ncbi:MAG: hypothetical protein EBZ34_03460 [Flavobacteriia bacterium]|nr:hypothetical protein [Flavobacteriia bacterium]